jgi:hypothetical protein
VDQPRCWASPRPWKVAYSPQWPPGRGRPSATCLIAASRHRRVSYRLPSLTSRLDCSDARGGERRPFALGTHPSLRHLPNGPRPRCRGASAPTSCSDLLERRPRRHETPLVERRGPLGEARPRQHKAANAFRWADLRSRRKTWSSLANFVATKFEGTENPPANGQSGESGIR